MSSVLGIIASFAQDPSVFQHRVFIPVVDGLTAFRTVLKDLLFFFVFFQLVFIDIFPFVHDHTSFSSGYYFAYAGFAPAGLH